MISRALNWLSQWLHRGASSNCSALRITSSGSIIASICLFAVPQTANAQAFQCRAAQGQIDVPRITRNGPVRNIAITGYTMSLSWSPEFCKGKEKSARHARQCSGRQGRFGFIVHGFWPDGRGDQWPQWCPTNRQPSQQAVRQSLCMTPSTQLLAREWAKHGACMVRNPDGYLRVTRILWNSYRWPDYNRLSYDRSLTAGDIRTAFANANRGIEPQHIGIVTKGNGWLKEMQICYGRDFMPRRCQGRKYGAANEARVKIWRGT